MVKLLHKGDEDRRRWNILDAARSKDPVYIPQLLARLDSDETLANKRHIVRALGKIGDRCAEEKLLELSEFATGLMLGDVAHSLGQIGSRKALPRLRILSSHDVDWVRQNAKWAIAQLE